MTLMHRGPLSHLPIRQRPKLVRFGDKWSVRDHHGGPFGPVNQSQKIAEFWLSDPVRVIVTATLMDHHDDYTQHNEAGGHPCWCGAPQATRSHQADMIAERLRAAGLVDE